ncbi:lipoprotein signal peptidase [Vicingus serpentipes]|uniref:Lipoprotein signal peptidase n=1 Tax=Vicingus serpentipes TaxID=1926625 RepID=A0A5C6RXV9_9FLAO|nr:lipoprotein signal peptidase [Vicingus serpentipes]TXB67091.1 lipoprotein signal peptidase [Vicingus serpentipes]
MKKFLNILSKPLTIIFLVLVIDQAVKIWIKTTMYLGQEFPVLGNWFYIHFTENPGMAFGMEFGGEWGKLALSLFRIVAVSGIAYVLFTLPKTTPKGLKICGSLILAGAIGNIIDSAFYGVIFNDSFNQLATFFPEGGGYETFLHGRVVDMFWFPLFEGTFPEWFPLWAGEDYLFFRPVFNIADAAISVGIGLIFIFQKRFFKTPAVEVNEEASQSE